MTQSEVIALALASGIAAFGYMVRSSMESIGTRLEKLEGKMESVLREITSTSTLQSVHTEEIGKIRDRLHECENTAMATNKIQELCVNCPNKG